jgi:pilus assembly protein Flp/PilA
LSFKVCTFGELPVEGVHSMLSKKLFIPSDEPKEKALIDFAVAQQLKLQDMLSELLARLEREEGQDLIEYSLLAALISVVSIAVIIILGGQIGVLFTTITNALKAA